ncbi:MAG: hypothetical protein M1833_000359 [Piccolia ochrophora]|nr:MAG: hypothetical protein M1833_000359 [Piccolia ochrophora]
MKSVANFAVGLVGATATLVFATDDYAPKQTYSVGTYHNECAATPCGQLGSLKECSREWYKALDACYAPPCNVRYVRDPAAECKVQDKGTLNAYVQATPTKDSYGQTPAPKSPLRGKYPKCAQPCLKDFLSTDGCNYADVQCHCSKNDAFTKSFETCETNCSASDWQATLIGLITECSRANYPLKAAETKLPSIKRRDRVDDAYPKLPQCATIESYQELERFCKDRGVDLAFPTVSTPVAPSATPGCPLNEYPNVPECSVSPKPHGKA